MPCNPWAIATCSLFLCQQGRSQNGNDAKIGAGHALLHSLLFNLLTKRGDCTQKAQWPLSRTIGIFSHSKHCYLLVAAVPLQRAVVAAGTPGLVTSLALLPSLASSEEPRSPAPTIFWLSWSLGFTNPSQASQTPA